MWQWRQLNKMHDGRDDRSGMLLLLPGGNKQRVLVAGGASRTAEILQLTCSDTSDIGQWTRIALLTMRFSSPSLVECCSRIFAIGSFLACITPFLFKGFIIPIIRLLRSVGRSEITYMQCAWSAHGKSNFDTQDTIFGANLSCFSRRWHLLSRLFGGL